MQPKPIHEGELTPEKFAAVHRALLSGLLSNVGQRTQAHEYTGARGNKFFIFPGSGQFSRNPPWVMSAELVRTTRLYARTVAAIDPRWIERAAEHLVKRTHTNPRWQESSAHVVADERITLFGLVLVPVRRVHYGPIDPRTSRNIFIQHALVQNELITRADYARHNQRLLEQAQTLQAKARRHDLLSDPAHRFAFFSARIPMDIHNGPAFERWRAQAELKSPQLLYLSWDDVVSPALNTLSVEQYPDILSDGALRLELRYVFDPARDDDGATVLLPMAALNQISADRLEWSVPGWLTLKIEALIRTLPKALRVAFVPAPQFAQEVAAKITFAQGPFLATVAQQLGRLGGVVVPPDAFSLDQVPPWLRLNICIIDAEGKTVAHGRDLNQLRRQLGIAARKTFKKLPPGPWSKDRLTRWDFADLPRSVEVHQHGLTLPGYPALVDAGQSVSLRLFDSPGASDIAHLAGVRRLFMLQVSHELQSILRGVRDMQALVLNFSTLGGAARLKETLAQAIADRAFFESAPDDDFRSRQGFIAHAESAWKRLNPLADEMMPVVRSSLEAYQQVLRLLDRATAPAWQPAVRDIREQLTLLMPADFLATTPWTWLQHYPRFLSGLLARLRKLIDFGLHRDTTQMAILSPFWRLMIQRYASERALGNVEPSLSQYRWMLEEFRISLFAQELRTSIPVSVQRLEAQWNIVQSAPPSV